MTPRPFSQPLPQWKNGAIESAAGRYIITNILEIKTRRRDSARRRGGQDVLFFPAASGNQPDWSETTTGRKRQLLLAAASWCSMALWGTGLANVTAGAKRSEHTLAVSDAKKFPPGQRH